MPEYKEENRRKENRRQNETAPVQDKPAETGIKINNIISFLILSVMAWVGYNIEDIKKNVAQTTTVTAVNKSDIKHLQDSLREHKLNHPK
jgi:hypothetical protein